MATTFISDAEHYSKVLDAAAKARRTLWIGTADIKDLYVTQGKAEKPFLGVLSDLIGKGVSVRLIHAKEPGQQFRQDFDRYRNLAAGLARRNVRLRNGDSPCATGTVPVVQIRATFAPS